MGLARMSRAPTGDVRSRGLGLGGVQTLTWPSPATEARRSPLGLQAAEWTPAACVPESSGPSLFVVRSQTCTLPFASNRASLRLSGLQVNDTIHVSMRTCRAA